MKSLNQALGRYASFGPMAIRVIIGGLFVLHGIDKFRNGLGGVEDMFASNGVPVASVSALFVAVAEVVGGAALIAGLFTRVAAAVLSVIMVGAIVFVTSGSGGGVLGNEVPLAYLAGLLAVIVLGPGRPSADEAMKTDETVIDLRSSVDARSAQPVG